ncbi:uncharacterized protein LOC128553525 [Mercenaria mercenaria]|uniref:uncharacterized protein LOC128553525 n=1 Tax=Mercenaria mercenaria TaxID=6596 RepID=UPI00234F0442|nr:uncharacterized protein LOC128553525 [Mercenaria mercenaria]
MAAVLGVRLAHNVINALQMKVCDVIFSSDGMNVLWWIQRESRTFKPFVANRVSEIQDKSVPNQWRHVTSKENSADIASRGMTASELVNCELWWKGPEFLMSAPEKWHKNDKEERKESKAEMRLSKLQQGDMSTFLVTDINQEVIDIGNYSSWHKMVRVLAWVLRFISNISCKRDDRRQCELVAEEIKDAESLLMQKAQRE